MCDFFFITFITVITFCIFTFFYVVLLVLGWSNCAQLMTWVSFPYGNG